jgi:hypothetical protein
VSFGFAVGSVVATVVWLLTWPHARLYDWIICGRIGEMPGVYMLFVVDRKGVRSVGWRQDVK